MFAKTVKTVAVVLLLSLSAYYFLPEAKLPNDVIIDKLVVLKSDRRLLAFSKGKLIKTYKISLGFYPTGKKEFEDDGKTPEGDYTINDKNPHSICHKNLGISYPQ